MLVILVVVFSATPLLNFWNVHDIKSGVAEANILFWFWCLHLNHHTPKTLSRSGLHSMLIDIMLATRFFDRASIFFILRSRDLCIKNSVKKWKQWMKDHKLKVILFSTCDDTYEDIKIKSKDSAPGLRLMIFWTSKQFKAGVAEKTFAKTLVYCWGMEVVLFPTNDRTRNQRSCSSVRYDQVSPQRSCHQKRVLPLEDLWDK